jgi:hypothetical protein
MLLETTVLFLGADYLTSIGMFLSALLVVGNLTTQKMTNPNILTSKSNKTSPKTVILKTWMGKIDYENVPRLHSFQRRSI